MDKGDSNVGYILAGITIQFAYKFIDTKKYFGIITVPGKQITGQAIEVDNTAYSDWRQAGNEIDSFAEFCLLCMPTSEYLLQHDRCIFHAAAIRWRDRAWLIAAGSGVGKSTQVKALTESWPDEMSIINGDKPALEYKEDRLVWVHPSPWNGKEGWHGAEAAKLGGVFLLNRGEKNAVRELTPKQAAPGIFLSVFQSYRNEEMIRDAAAFSTKILNAVPVFLYTSNDVQGSIKLLYNTMKQVMEGYENQGE